MRTHVSAMALTWIVFLAFGAAAPAKERTVWTHARGFFVKQEGKHWTELCALYDRQLGRGLPPADTVALHQRLAEIYLGEYNNTNE